MIFLGHILQDKFPYRENLFNQKVIVDLKVIFCILCGVWPESASRMFITCYLASSVQFKILEWLGVQLAIPRDLMTLFEFFLSLRPKAMYNTLNPEYNFNA